MTEDGSMTTHICERCGHEDQCSYGSWPDRHPVAATIGGLVSLVFMGMMFSVHPVASAVMVSLAVTWAAVRVTLQESRRRVAVATRADYEHAQLQLRASLPQVRRRPVARASDCRTHPLPVR